MRNGISVGARGEILACAYALESAGLMGNIREGGLSQFIGRANAAIDRFHEQYRHTRCIVRHPHYDKFTEVLKR